MQKLLQKLAKTDMIIFGIGNAMKMALRILQQLNVADANILIDLMRQNPHLFKCMCSADKWRIQLGGLLMYLHLPLGLRIFKLYV